MKRTFRIFLILALVLTALCITALADGIYVTEQSGATLTPTGGTGTEQVEIDGKTQRVYTGAEKVEVTIPAESVTSGKYYLILALDNGEVPNENNIRYIDQKTSNSEALTFTVYPDKLESNKTYTVWVASNDGNGMTEVGSFQYYQAYTLGDVNSDGNIDISDAMAIINHIVLREVIEPGSAKYLAANVTAASGDVAIDISDAMEIINYVVFRPQYLKREN